MDAKFVNMGILLGAACMLHSGCADQRLDLLRRKWKTVALQNLKMEQEIASARAYIDTLGARDPELRAAMDVDSLRQVLRADLERSVQEQQTALGNTFMEFSPNGVAYTTSIDGVDSAYYTLEDDQIRIDEAKLKGRGETMTFHILELNKDTMKLKLVDYGDTSVAVMVPVE